MMPSGRRFHLGLIPLIGIVAAGMVFAQPEAEEVAYEGLSASGWVRAKRMLRSYDITLEPPVSRISADDAAFYLRQVLLEDGFSEADVTYDFQGRKVVFRVSQGSRHMISQVSIVGADAISGSVRREIVESAMRRETLTPFGPIPFFEDAAALASRDLGVALAQAGYLDATVAYDVESIGDRRHVTFVANPGLRYVTSEVRVSGFELPKDLERDLRRGVGEPYRAGDEFVLRTQFLQALRNRGHFDAEVSASVDKRADGKVGIFLDAIPGRVFTLGTIRVNGGRTVSARTVLRKIPLRDGRPFDAAAFDAAMRRLWLTGAFETITPSFHPGSNGVLDIDLEVEEAVAKQFSATIGYGQWEMGFANLIYTDSNFLGTLNRLTVEGLVSFRSYGASISLTDPSIFGWDAAGGIKGIFMRRETPAYRSTQYGGAFAVERRFDASNETGWNAGVEWRTITDSTIFAGGELDGAPINYSFGAVSFGQSFDRRNDPLIPMQGTYFNWNGFLASDALADEIAFLRVRGQATWYVPLQKLEPYRPFVPFLVFNHRAGLITPLAGTSTVPVQERFFLGGPDTVRSFQLDGMAPRDSEGAPGGGLFFLLANAELQIPVFRALYLVGFLDAGNLATSLEEFQWEDTRVAAGLGARLYTPLGAVRMDYGYNLIRGEGDPIGAWQFGFGFTF